MTKVQATNIFKSNYGCFTEESKTKRIDIVQDWGYFIDGLQKDGRITVKQYENWTCPV